MYSPTVEELERLAAQLSPREQLQLVARIAEKLSQFLSFPASIREPEEKYGTPQQPAKMEAWLLECERVADLWQGSFDSAADLRRLREEG